MFRKDSKEQSKAMNNLRQLYKDGAISKQKFIKQMHEHHSILFEYRDLLKNNIIKKIEISENLVIMTFHDIKMIIDEYDERTAPIEALNFSGYEKEETDFILTIIGESLHPDFTVFDIGANVGWYSLNISKKFPGIKIHAFEPIPKTFRYLNDNIKLNGLKNITTNTFGLSNSDKNVLFYYYKEGSGNSSLVNLSNRGEEMSSKVYELDNYVKNNNLRVDFIKCDVEGAELFVFEGALKTLKDQKPIVFTEMLRKWSSRFNYHPNVIISLFRNIGYNCYTLRDGKLIPFSFMKEDTVETNFFFLHKEYHAEKILRFN
jgi:FkbM family methyltransferase